MTASFRELWQRSLPPVHESFGPCRYATKGKRRKEGCGNFAAVLGSFDAPPPWKRGLCVKCWDESLDKADEVQAKHQLRLQTKQAKAALAARQLAARQEGRSERQQWMALARAKRKKTKGGKEHGEQGNGMPGAEL